MVEWKKLDEVFELRNGYTPSKSNPEFWTDGTIPWFRMEDIRQNGQILSDSIQHITPEAIKKSGLFPANTIIVATTATIGEHALVIVDSLANQRFTGLITRKSLTRSVLPRFAYYYCFLLDDWCKKHVHQGGFSSVDMDGFKKFPFPILSLEEQERIVGILDTFTAAIDNLKKQIEERRKQYEFYRDQLLDLEGKEGVEMVVLGAECSVINGRAYKQEELLNNGKYRVLRVGNFFSNDNWYYSDLELDDKYYCKRGDLLYAWSASFGPHIWEEEKTIYHYHIWKLDCSKRLNKKYLYYWLGSTYMEDQALSQKHGATMAHLTKALMEKLRVPVPPLSQQQQIVAKLDAFEATINNLEQQLAMRQKQYEYYRNKLLTFE